jgi:hypothetical protein
MSNHLHIIVHTEGYELSDVLRDFKKFTASSILKGCKSQFRGEGNRKGCPYKLRECGAQL